MREKPFFVKNILKKRLTNDAERITIETVETSSVDIGFSESPFFGCETGKQIRR